MTHKYQSILARGIAFFPHKALATVVKHHINFLIRQCKSRKLRTDHIKQLLFYDENVGYNLKFRMKMAQREERLVGLVKLLKICGYERRRVSPNVGLLV